MLGGGGCAVVTTQRADVTADAAGVAAPGPDLVGTWRGTAFAVPGSTYGITTPVELQIRPDGTWTVVAVIGGVFGFFVAGYTGVLLAVTNRPIWADTPLLGLVFVVSAASTSAALLILLARRRWGTLPGLHDLRRFDAMVLVVELLAVIALVVSLGPMARAWLNAWGALLLVGVILIGILVPLVLHVMEGRRRPVLRRDLATPVAALLVLVGGFVLRVVIVLSAQRIGV